jgi:hypothetical protein
MSKVDLNEYLDDRYNAELDAESSMGEFVQSFGYTEADQDAILTEVEKILEDTLEDDQVKLIFKTLNKVLGTNEFYQIIGNACEHFAHDSYRSVTNSIYSHGYHGHDIEFEIPEEYTDDDKSECDYYISYEWAYIGSYITHHMILDAEVLLNNLK